jgi:hypothetical protein
MMFDHFFLVDTAERAVKTAAQSALLAIGADQLNTLAADWQTVASFALGGAVLSVLTSLASLHIGPEDSPRVVQ